MTLDALVLLLLVPGAIAEDADDTIGEHRRSFDELVESAIGLASRPVEYDWRESSVQLALQGTHLYELNNFNSLRAGGLVRLPGESTLFELGLNYVAVWDSPSSDLLALTPYRQPGRPDRLELDVSMAIPLAEGIVTARPRFFPPVELVLNGYAGLRYVVYPTAFGGMKAGQIAGAILSPVLTDAEQANLDEWRLDSMRVDRARYTMVVGVGNDLYFHSGVFLSPRALFAVPVLAPITGTELWFWAELTLAVGYALP